ncbi:L-seryl-tRNA(Sec) selenium transferase [Bienertia sinuspersici]
MERAWIVASDFNCLLEEGDRLGRLVLDRECKEFRDCLGNCQLQDLKRVRAHFTWTNEQASEARVYSKIDRVLVKEDWTLVFPTAYAHFQPEQWLDHCPTAIHLEDGNSGGAKPFRYFDMWSSHPSVKDIVRTAWSHGVSGMRIFQVSRKLKEVKARLKTLNRQEYSEIRARYMACKDRLMSQKKIQEDKGNKQRWEEEGNMRAQFLGIRKDYYSFLNKKCKAK